MTTFRDAIAGAVKKGFCQIVGNLDRGHALLQRKVTGDTYDDFNFPGGVNRLLCDRPTPIEPPPPQPIGGKCPVPYNVRGVMTSANPGLAPCGESVEWTTTISGPDISLVRRAGTVRVISASGGDNAPSVIGSSFQGIDERPDCVFRGAGVAYAFEGSTAITSITRVDGQPDNCASAPPTIGPLPPGWNETSDDVTYTDDGGNNVNVPVNLFFGYADVDIDANINVPVNIDVGGVHINADVNLTTGDINIGPVTNNYGDRQPGTRPRDVIPPPNSPAPGNPPEVTPPPPPTTEEKERGERVIIGALVTTTLNSSGRISTLFQDVNPDIKIPSLGHISFLCRVGDVGGGWTKDIPIKNIREIVQCPWIAGAIDVKGTPQPGVQWVITPLYDRKKAPRQFPVPTT